MTPLRPTPTARVTRLTPAGSTLTRADGRAVEVGAMVTDGEALTLATVTGGGGAVTLDRRGVTLRLTMVRLPPASASVEAAAPTPEAPPDVKPLPPRRLPMVDAVGAGPANVEAASTPR